MKHLRITAVLAAFAAVFVLGVSPASAHYVQPKLPVPKMSLHRQHVYWSWSAKHYRYVCIESNVASIRRAHCKAFAWAKAHDRAVRAKLHPPLPSHYAMWMCIHGREGAWNSQTGNGYYGGLQMTYGWAGRVSNAALMSPAAQIAAAEAEYAANGYSLSWLYSQWPNTAPPCT